MVSSVKLTGIETSQGPIVRNLAPTKPCVSQPLKKLGRFEIHSVLGEGAFGKVYRARDPQLDREVAVKVPHFSSQQSREDRQRFLREARSAAGLQHPNICPVHEVGSLDGHDYIVLAFIDGKPLSKVLQSKPQLSDRQIVAVIRKIALALQEAHDKGIVHRDLKPANIMINRKGEPVIMDFGLARRSNSGDAQISQQGQIMGTPAYMSPEQARGDGKSVGPASDVYSLGIVLYELLCGRRPFEGTVTEVIGQILHVEAPPPAQFRPEVDLRLQAICLKSIAKNRTDRYASMQDLASALADYLKTIPSRERSADGPQAEGKLAKDLNTTQFADLLAAITSDVESKVEGAVRRAGSSSRVPKWPYLVGSGLISAVMLLGIFFFIRKDTVTVIVNIPGIDSKDPSFTFLLDDEVIPAETFEAPVELKPGKHVLVVNKDGKQFKRFLFNVGKEDNEKVVVQDVTPKSLTPETVIERPAPQITVPGPAIAPFTTDQAQLHQEAWAKHLDVPVEYTNSIGMKFRLIPPGVFTMGTPADEIAAMLRSTRPDDRPAGDLRSVDAIASEGPQHQVELTHAVYLGVFEVTQGQYKSVTGTNPSAFQEKGSDRQFVTRIKGLDTSVFPVEAVSWLDAAEFCAKLSRSEELKPYYFVAQNNEVTILNGTGYRLPTEAVWEFACRAGTITRYWNGDDAREVKKIAWLFGNAGGRTHAVGELPANPFGLHDVSGNLWEWVEDGWDPKAYQQFADHPAVDPLTPAATGARRVLRGGIWSYGPSEARSSKRMAGIPTLRWHQPGFRVALSVEAVRQTMKSKSALQTENKE